MVAPNPDLRVSVAARRTLRMHRQECLHPTNPKAGFVGTPVSVPHKPTHARNRHLCCLAARLADSHASERGADCFGTSLKTLSLFVGHVGLKDALDAVATNNAGQ